MAPRGPAPVVESKSLTRVLEHRVLDVHFHFFCLEQCPRRVPGRAFGAPMASQGALGKVDQVHWGPFWGVQTEKQRFGAMVVLP